MAPIPSGGLSGLSSEREVIFWVQPLAGVGRPLAYKAAPELDPFPSVGSLVRIPLQRRQVCGVVTGAFDGAEVPSGKLRSILHTLYPYPVAPKPLMALTAWMGTYYGATPEKCWETVIPSPIRRGMGSREIAMVALIAEKDKQPLGEPRGTRQKAILAFLREQIRPLPQRLILSRLGVSAQSLQSLEKGGWVRIWREVEFRDAHLSSTESGAASTPPPSLTGEQSAALADLRPLLDQRFKVHLLHGVTGSGKTEVYLSLIEEVLRRNQSILFLVPEVLLAPQTVGRIRQRLEGLGESVVVWHSHLSEGQRADAWIRVASGQSRVVVGARSAVFAPLFHPGLIIVDEEHEPAYKQDETPRYHGRDVAVKRAQLEGVLCLLGSATPSLESFLNVRKGKYGLSVLKERVEQRPLPTMRVVDMRKEIRSNGGNALFSRLLVDSLRQRLERSEQAILFLNRRGFSTSLMCGECGHVVMCPHCEIPYTYHRTHHRLKCHLCGDEQPVPTDCPACGAQRWNTRGYGTQRVEKTIQELFPKARIARIDADAMQKRHRFEEVLTQFRNGDIDFLVGTQMVAKGLDFPKVTLVALIDADRSLHQEDFRAAERTFQLLVQVSGRAGRHTLPGEVIVQTMTPEAAPILAARLGQFEAFWEEELANRQALAYPPYRHLIRQVFSGRSRDKVQFYASAFARQARSFFDASVEIRGPAAPPIEKLNDLYRFQIAYFTERVASFMNRYAKLRESFPLDPEIRQIVDVDPQSIG